MPLKAIITKEAHAALAPALQSEYVEKDGRYMLAVEAVEGYGLDSIEKLRGALEKERNRGDEAERKLTAFKDLDPVKAREALGKLDEIANWKPDEKTREAVQAQIRKQEEAFTAKLAEATKRGDSYEQKYRQTLLSNAATAAIARSGGNPDLLASIVMGRLGVVSENGSDAVVVLGDDGSPKISGKPGNLGRMTVEEFVSSMAEDKRYAPAFAGNGPSGAGSRQSSEGASGAIRLSSADARDPARYRAAKAEAEKTGRPFEIV